MEFEEAMIARSEVQENWKAQMAKDREALLQAHRDKFLAPVMERLDAIEEKLEELTELVRTEGTRIEVHASSDDWGGGYPYEGGF